MEASVISPKADINALWSKQSGGTDSQLTISSGGTYCLTADLVTGALLAIDAPGKNIVIKLQGHRLTCTEKTMGAAVRVMSAKSVTIEGDGADSSKIVYKGATVPCAVKSEAGTLTLKNLSIESSTDDKHINLNKQNGSGVQVTGGKLVMSRCSVSVDMSNQSAAVDNASRSVKESPSAILIGSEASGATIKNCKVKAVGSPRVVRCSDADDTLAYVYVYGLQSLTSKRVTMVGSSFSAVSAQGDCWCLTAGSADPSCSVSWQLKGACSFKSSNNTHMARYREPLVLDAAVSFDGPVTVNSVGLEKRVVAQAASCSGSIAPLIS